MRCYYGQGICRKFEKADKHYRRSADQGDGESQWRYGKCLVKGRGVNENLIVAAEYFKRSAVQGNARRQFYSAICMMTRLDQSRDMREAACCMKLFISHAKDVDQYAMTVASVSEDGRSLNLSETAMLLKKPAEQ
jgi:TPR repeat protein